MTIQNFKNKYFTESDVIVAVSFELFIEGSVQSQFINVMPIALAREIISNFLKGAETFGIVEPENNIINESKNSTIEQEINETRKSSMPVVSEDNEEDKAIVRGSSSKKINLKKKEQTPVSVRPMQFDELDDDDEELLSEEQMSNLELIMSVPLEISVEIGKTKKQIKDILEISQGTIIELDKQAGALVDIIVNGQLIAKGEVVVVNDNFGVRVAEIVKKDELMKITL